LASSKPSIGRPSFSSTIAASRSESDASLTRTQYEALGSAPDPPAKLMQLGETESLCAQDDHDRRVRYVDADLDDGGGHQHVDLAIGEPTHHRVALFRGHAAVHEGEAQTAELFLAKLLFGSRWRWARRRRPPPQDRSAA